MKSLSDDLRALVEAAAELRAAGATWDTIGKHVERTGDTCRRWPRLYADVWNPIFRDAEARLIADAGTEALTVLRLLMRSEDERIRRDVARFLLKLHFDIGKLQIKSNASESPPTLLEQIAKYVEGLSDEQLQRERAEVPADIHALPMRVLSESGELVPQSEE